MITLDSFDDNADDNGVSNAYERLKRWREKNPYSAKELQQKYRKKKKGGDATCSATAIQDKPMSTSIGATVSSPVILPQASSGAETVQPSSASKSVIEQLRESIKPQNLPPPIKVELPSKRKRHWHPISGVELTEAQWNAWQDKTAKAKESRWEPDEFSQDLR